MVTYLLRKHHRGAPAALELSAAPGGGGPPIHEWIEVGAFLDAAPPVDG